MHEEAHPLAGKKVVLNARSADPVQSAVREGETFELEDWADKLFGGSWMNHYGNPACMLYGMRAGMTSLPADDEVVYGKINGLGYLVHVTELGEESP